MDEKNDLEAENKEVTRGLEALAIDLIFVKDFIFVIYIFKER